MCMPLWPSPLQLGASDLVLRGLAPHVKLFAKVFLIATHDLLYKAMSSFSKIVLGLFLGTSALLIAWSSLERIDRRFFVLLKTRKRMPKTLGLLLITLPIACTGDSDSQVTIL